MSTLNNDHTSRLNKEHTSRPRILPPKVNTGALKQDVLDQGDMSKLRRQLLDKLKSSKMADLDIKSKSPVRLEQASVDSAYFEPSTSTPEERPASRLSVGATRVSPNKYLGQSYSPGPMLRYDATPEEHRPSSKMSRDEGQFREASYVRFDLSPGRREKRSPNAMGQKLQSTVDAMRKRRQQENMDIKKRLSELEQLKVSLEQHQAKSSMIDSEVSPLKMKITKLEGIIDEQERQLRKQQEERVQREQQRIAEMCNVEDEKRKMLEKIENMKLESDVGLKENVRQLKNKNELLKREMEGIQKQLQAQSMPKFDIDNSPKLLQIRNLKQELINVRRVLESSEQERLKERKEKLTSIHSMIRLTKEKSYLEEELEIRKKTDTKEGGDKYTRLLEKYEKVNKKFNLLLEQKATEIEELEKKHMKEVWNLKSKTEKLSLAPELEVANCFGRMSPGLKIHFSSSVMQNNKELENFKKKFDVLQADEQLDPSTKEVLSSLYEQYSSLCQQINIRSSTPDIHDADSIAPDTDDLEHSAKQTSRQVEILIAEKHNLKRKLDVVQTELKGKDREFQVAEGSYKRQLEQLLQEKTSISLQMQKLEEQTSNHKDEMADISEELQTCKETLEKRNTDLSLMRENLMSVTSEMTNVDAEIGKLRRDIAIKDAEIMRLNQDIVDGMEQLQDEKNAHHRTVETLDNIREGVKDNQKNIVTLEGKLQDVSEQLQANKLQNERLSSERDSLANQLKNTQMDNVEHQNKSRQFENMIDSLKMQSTSLEQTLALKMELLSAATFEVEKKKTELLATQHLLTEEELSHNRLRDDFDEITKELQLKEEMLKETQERNRILERNLRIAHGDLDDMQSECKDTEVNLHNRTVTKQVLEQELKQLQDRYSSLSLEKQKISGLYETLQQANVEDDQEKSDLKSKLASLKRDLQEKTKQYNEASFQQEQLLRKVAYLTKEMETLKSSMNSSPKRMADVLNKLKTKNSNLTGELKILKEEKRKMLDMTATDFEAMKADKSRIEKDVMGSSGMLEDEEEPFEEIFLENELEAGVDMLAMLDAMDDEKPPNKSSQRKSQKSKKRDIIDEETLLQDDIDTLMAAYNGISDDERPPAGVTRKGQGRNLAQEVGNYKKQLQNAKSELSNLKIALKKKEDQLAAAANGKGTFTNEEKEETLHCLKSLVSENEALAHCVREQKDALKHKQNELSCANDTLKDLLEKYTLEQDVLCKTRERLRDVMETTLTRESNISIDQQKQISELCKEVDTLRKENKDLQYKMEDKSTLLEKSQEDLSKLKAAIEFNLGSFEAERKSKEVIESQLQIAMQERGSTQQQLAATQLTNKMLQSKLLSLQNWHNVLERNLLRSVDPDSKPWKFNHDTHEDFIKNQLKAVTDKLLEVESSNTNLLSNSLENSPTKDNVKTPS